MANMDYDSVCTAETRDFKAVSEARFCCQDPVLFVHLSLYLLAFLLSPVN